MERYTINDGATSYTRISKSDARKMFNANQSFYIIAHKMRPGFPFSMGMTIDPAHIKAERSLTPTYPTLCWYNAASYETGYYAAFYTMKAR